jgi:predicted GNAT family acetyltransferase
MKAMSDIRQNSALSRFELDIDGHIAFANYRMAGDVMLMPHTETPPALRERGIGERVVLGAFAHARAHGLKVRPMCSFVRHVMAEHPEYQDLLG